MLVAIVINPYLYPATEIYQKYTVLIEGRLNMPSLYVWYFDILYASIQVPNYYELVASVYYLDWVL